MADEIGVIERVIDSNGRRAFRIFYLYAVDIKDAKGVLVPVTPPEFIDEVVKRRLLKASEIEGLTEGSLAYEEPPIINRRKDIDGPLEDTPALLARVMLDYAKRKAQFIVENTDRFKRTGQRISV